MSRKRSPNGTRQEYSYYGVRGVDEATQALIAAKAALLDITQGELITRAVRSYCKTTRPKSDLSDSDRALLDFMSSPQRERDDGTHKPA